jgi:hypothetical protein
MAGAGLQALATSRQHARAGDVALPSAMTASESIAAA